MRKNFKTIECKTAIIAAAAALSLALAGCAGSIPVSPLSTVIAGSPLTGSVHGGQQPIGGATLNLYAASTAGYAATNTPFATTTTTAYGNFTIGPTYNCTAGQQVYLTATGGNPSPGTNANSALMAALGDCANLGNLTFILVNEVTTVGSVFALAPFMSPATAQGAALGTSSTNTAGLARAFASVKKLVNIGTGSSTGSALPANATGPVNTINTLADILAVCVNSTGGVATNTSTPCGLLFSLTTPANGTAPTDTIQAALNIALNPTLNTAKLYNSALPASPFIPILGGIPTDFTLGIKYRNVGLATPQSATIDGSGQVWFANSSNNSVTVLAQTGLPISASPIAGNSLAAPAAVAIDASGNAWVANQTGNSISVFSPAGASSANYTASGNLSGPNALAFDASGNLFIANLTGNSLVEINSSGTFVAKSTSGVSGPTAVAVDGK